MKHSENNLKSSKDSPINADKNVVPSATGVTTVRTIAMILALGVLRLQNRQKDLDNPTEQRVHDHVLVTQGETL